MPSIMWGLTCNCKNIGRMVMAKYPHIQWTPCAAHSLDLLIEDIAGLTWVTEILTKTKYQQKNSNILPV